MNHFRCHSLCKYLGKKIAYNVSSFLQYGTGGRNTGTKYLRNAAVNNSRKKGRY